MWDLNNSNATICDVINENESELRNTDFKVEPKKQIIYLFPIVF